MTGKKKIQVKVVVHLHRKKYKLKKFNWMK